MFRLYRSIATVFVFLMFSVGAVTLGTVVNLIIELIVRNKDKKQQILRYLVKKSFQFIVRICSIFSVFKVKFRNIDLLEQKHGYVIISNHPTLADYLILYSRLNNSTTVMVADKLNRTFMRKIICNMGYVSNNVDAEKITTILSDSDNILIFPEGTRTRNSKYLKFHRGAVNFSIRNQMPIIPIFIKCSEPTFLSDKFFNWKAPETIPVFSISVGNVIDYRNLINTNEPTSIQIRKLNNYLEKLYNREIQSAEETVPPSKYD